MRKLYFLTFVPLILSTGAIYAQEQVSSVDSYYYNEGVKSEKDGDLPGARAAYRALELYAQSDREAQIARKKIVEIDLEIAENNQTVVAAKPAAVKSATRASVAALNFKTFYNGDEPFLQNNTSDLARKILNNIKGIELAQRGDIVSARKAFQEALDIDSSFTPARENLETIAKI